MRIYEITRLGRERAPAQLVTRVIRADFIVLLEDADPLEPWRGIRGGNALSPADMANLDNALTASGFDAPAPSGLNLPSDGFYWVVVTCRSGQLHFNAWTWPSERFDRTPFQEMLATFDDTGIYFARPRPGPTRIQQTMGSTRDRAAATKSIFDLEVGDNGLKGIPSLF